MKKNIVIFTHNDLDAMGCLLSINEYFPDDVYDKHTFHTNYQDIPSKIDRVKRQCEMEKPELVIICDISFSTNKLELHRFYNFTEDNGIRILYMDHHLYPDDFFPTFPNLKLVWDKDRCAAKITRDTLLPNCTHDLSRIIDIIDIYDIWQDKHKWFTFAQKLNDYFWHCISSKMSITEIAQSLKSRNFKLWDDFQTITDNICKDNEDNLIKLEESGLIHRNTEKKVSLFLSNDYFTPFMIKEHLSGQTFVVNICNWGLIKVRVSQHANVDEWVLNHIRLNCTGTADIGHAHAFTWKSDLDFVNHPVDSLMAEAKRISNIIDVAMYPKFQKDPYIDFDDDIPF